MAFAPVCLSPDAPRIFKKFSQQKIERQFLEPVHQLMRRGVQRCAPQTTFEVTIVNNLLAVISGLSALGYVQKGNDSGVRFRQVLFDQYPWSCEPVQISDRAVWVEALYFRYRNPFAHSLGLDDRDMRAIKGTRLPLRTSGTYRGYSETDLNQIEVAKIRPQWPETLRFNSVRILLKTEGLYWGVRRTIEAMSQDGGCMINAERFLRSLPHW